MIPAGAKRNEAAEQQPRSALASALLAPLASLLAFLPSLRNHFALDDFPHFIDNPQTRSLGAALAAFFEPFPPGNLYRPAVTLSFALTRRLFGLAPWPYHLTNVLLHCLAAYLVLLLLRRFMSPAAALAGSLVFAVHPLHTEAVANIANRSELLCHTAGLAALLLCLTARPPRPAGVWRAAAAALCLLLSFLSKESGLAWLVLIPLCRAFDPRRAGLSRRAAAAVLVVPAAAYFSLRAAALGGAIFSDLPISPIDNPLAAAPAPVRIVNALSLLGRYIYLCLFPFRLSADYSLAQLEVVSDWRGPLFLLQLTAAAGLAAAAVFGLRARRVESLWALWFFCGLLATANVLFPIGTIFAERLAFLSSAGISALAALGLRRIASTTLRTSLTALIVAIFAAQSALYSMVWRDNDSLYSHQIEAAPRSVLTMVNYSVVLRNRGQAGRSEELALRALDVAPDFPEAAYALAALHLSQSKNESGERWLQRALELAPRHLGALGTLGRLRLAQGKLDEADAIFRGMLAIEPRNLDGRLGRLAVAINRRQFPEAARLRDELADDYPENAELKMLSRGLERMRRE